MTVEMLGSSLSAENMDKLRRERDTSVKAILAERDTAIAECGEQARLLGMSASREEALLAKYELQLRENAALLAANRDCIVHFETLKCDYDKQVMEIGRLRKALQNVHNDGATWSAQTYIRDTLEVTK